MADPTQQTTAPATPPANATPDAPPPAAPQPYAVFPDAESFQKRVERESRKALKDLGVDDPAAIKTMLAEYGKMQAAAEEAKRQQMTEVDRLRADLATHQAKALEASSAAEEAKLRAHLYQVFSRKGVQNFDYGFWLVTNKLAGLADDAEPLDEEAFLDTMASDPATRAALGIAPAPAAEPPAVFRPANTSPVQGRAPQAPPPNPAIPNKTAMDMSPAEWVAYKQQIGIAT